MAGLGTSAISVPSIGTNLGGGFSPQPVKVTPGAGYEYDPEGNIYKTPVQKATEAGSALNALANITGLNLLGGSSSSSASAGGAGGAGGYVSPIAFPDTTAATDAVFARAKDKAALNARASLRGLTEAMASRNMLGSGVESAGMGEVVGRAGQSVGDTIREQAIQEAAARQRAAEMEYQGRITQRGQDINAAQEAAQRQQQALQGLLSVINSSGILY